VITFMAECFWPGVTTAKVAEVGERLREAARAIDSHGRTARYIGSILVPTDEIALCLFEAPSKAMASRLSTDAEVPSERVIPIVHLPAGERRTESRGAR
jgi:hypothetical protein